MAVRDAGSIIRELRLKEIEPDYLVDNICEYNAEEILDLCYRLDHREEQK